MTIINHHKIEYVNPKGMPANIGGIAKTQRLILIQSMKEKEENKTCFRIQRAGNQRQDRKNKR